MGGDRQLKLKRVCGGRKLHKVQINSWNIIESQAIRFIILRKNVVGDQKMMIDRLCLALNFYTLTYSPNYLEGDIWWRFSRRYKLLWPGEGV